MSSHAPGPWKLVFTGVASTPDWHVQTEEGRLIVLIPTPSTKKHEETRANAHLISAAPDLLSALEYLIQLSDVNEPIEERDVEIARAAVAKAKGGVP